MLCFKHYLLLCNLSHSYIPFCGNLYITMVMQAFFNQGLSLTLTFHIGLTEPYKSTPFLYNLAQQWSLLSLYTYNPKNFLELNFFINNSSNFLSFLLVPNFRFCQLFLIALTYATYCNPC